MCGKLLIVISIVFSVISIHAQATEFSYQGSLKDGVSAASGNYDFEFALFDAPSGGAQIGSTLVRSTVNVSNGIFSVSLDFGGVFPGANRFLEIRVRLTGQPGLTTLGPRQLVSSAPYSVKSLNADNAATATNAAQLGGVAASQYVVTTDPRMTDARSPTSGSSNYIQNQNASPQASSNFNISGNGTAGGTLSGNIVSATTQYNIGSDRVLAYDSIKSNTFVGRNGLLNTIGEGNAFFGKSAGGLNTIASNNTFLGTLAGFNTINGGQNTFVGYRAGYTNVNGSNNTVIGDNADIGSASVSYATAIGKGAVVNQDFSLVLGQVGGIAPIKVGIGTSAPQTLLHVNSTGSGGEILTTGPFAGFVFRDRASSVNTDDWLWYSSGNTARLYRNGTDHLLISSTGLVTLPALGAGGTATLCRNGPNQISFCSSSLRYKTNISSFSDGMSFVSKLRPISFEWKDGGMKDIGFGAEDVAKIDSRFVTYNEKGEAEGVKYDRLSVAFVNAFKEQQAEIRELRELSNEQARKIDELKKLLCLTNKTAEVCRDK